jgi:hypothetical protein
MRPAISGILDQAVKRGYPMKQFPLMSFLLILALATPAMGGVEVLDSTGLVERDIYGAPSPVPGHCYWEKDENAGPDFHATEADGYGNDGCPYPWLAHCDGDSLVYHGTWPLIEGLYLLGPTTGPHSPAA